MQIRTSEKSFIELEEYKGNYSLASCYEGTDGTVRKEWAKRQMGKDKYADKATPVKVFLGNRETAIAVLQTLMAELKSPF
jgi:hypothetical protein